MRSDNDVARRGVSCVGTLFLYVFKTPLVSILFPGSCWCSFDPVDDRLPDACVGLGCFKVRPAVLHVFAAVLPTVARGFETVGQHVLC